jgi:dihydrolipoamide dehydrogenase
MIRSASVFETVRTCEDYCIGATNAAFDYPGIVSRKDEVIRINEQGIENLLRKHKIELVKGEASIHSPGKVAVKTDGAERILEGDFIIIATGSHSFEPPFARIDNDIIFDCEIALQKKTLPKKVIILGGGILGCEFASLYNSFGCGVTIVEKLPALMPTWDNDMSRALATSFKKRAIEIRTGATVNSVETDKKTLCATVTLDGGEKLIADACLVALGRRPNTEGIGIEKAGINLWKDRFRGIEVDASMKTNVPGIYAIGDVNGIRPLAHIASSQAITAVEDMIGISTPTRYDAVPDCFWAPPELASVGMSEQEARDRGIDYLTGKSLYRSHGISHALGKIEGFVKSVIEKGTGKVLGVHICGYGAPDIIAEASVIVTAGLTVRDIHETIHAHPTLGEIIKEGILAARGMNIHG